LLDESILNLQITILLTIGTLIFIIVSFKRRDLIAYLPSYLIVPVGYTFIYLQIFNDSFRLLGNFFFLIGILAFLLAIYYDYFKTFKKFGKNSKINPKNGKKLFQMSPILSLIIGVQIIFSILILIAVFMLVKLFLMKRSTKHATLIVYLTSALTVAVSTLLSYFQLPGMWEFSFVATFILSAVYLMFPIILFLEEKLVKSTLEVKETEEKYRLISENANDLIAILNDKYEYEYINEQAYRNFLGYSKDQLIGRVVWDLVHPEDFKNIINSQQLSVDGFQALNGEDKAELRIKHNNGTYIWIEYTGKVFINSEGNPNVIVISRDITERKIAEEALKASEKRYRQLFENSPIALMEQDYSEMKKHVDYLKTSGIDDFQTYFDDKPDEVLNLMAKIRIIDVNRKTLELYRVRSKDEFIMQMNQLNKTKKDTMSEEVILDNKREMLSLINGDVIYESEIASETSFGDIMYVYSKTSIVPGFENTWSKIIVTIIDMTDIIKAEQELKESEEKFRTITEQSFIGVIIEQGYDIKYVNHQFSAILGYNSEELLNWTLPDFYEIVHPDDVDRFKKLIDDKGKGMFDKITNFQFRAFKKTGEIIWLELFSRKIMYNEGSANLAFILDITEKREAEQLILEENKKLVELDNLRKELITRISHELRTPLTSMYAASQILLRSNKEDSIEKVLPYIEISHHGSIRLKELIDNLLDASRIENGKLELRYSTEIINAIIHDCVKELNYLADNRQVTINMNLTTDVSFKLDKHRFSQVLINILSNAIKNTPPNGMVFIMLNETDDYVDIIIKDTGVGLTQEEKAKLFQKFGKIERFGMNLGVDIEGAGLGLYISKEIVELHDGQILIESEGRHKGSSFIIRLNKGVDKT
jgi:PAS domain S-box-containing protein